MLLGWEPLVNLLSPALDRQQSINCSERQLWSAVRPRWTSPLSLHSLHCVYCKVMEVRYLKGATGLSEIHPCGIFKMIEVSDIHHLFHEHTQTCVSADMSIHTHWQKAFFLLLEPARFILSYWTQIHQVSCFSQISSLRKFLFDIYFLFIPFILNFIHVVFASSVAKALLSTELFFEEKLQTVPQESN